VKSLAVSGFGLVLQRAQAGRTAVMAVAMMAIAVDDHGAIL
jgi:hypothetical protein